MKILAIKMIGRVGDDSDFVTIDLKAEVNYVDLWQKTKNSAKVFAFHTSHGSYLALSTLSQLSIGYADYGFELYDRSTAINKSRVMEIEPSDKNGSTVIFIDGSRVDVRKQIL